MSDFQLHPNLASKPLIVDLPLCSVLLEDNRHYPWVLFVPRRPHLLRMVDLPFAEQVQLLRELDGGQRIFLAEFQPTQLNVAAIGNKTPQLHVHLIARREGDPAWPGTVWDHPVRDPYTKVEREAMVARLAEQFQRIGNVCCISSML